MSKAHANNYLIDTNDDEDFTATVTEEDVEFRSESSRYLTERNLKIREGAKDSEDESPDDLTSNCEQETTVESYLSRVVLQFVVEAYAATGKVLL